MAMHWPFHVDVSDSTHKSLATSKSTAYSNIRDSNKSIRTHIDKDILHQAFSPLPSNNLPSPNPSTMNGKKAEINKRIISNKSTSSFDQHQQHIGWNLKAQEDIITYQLPDGLPDGLALHNKLQKLMKTNTIYLNDRQFWTTLENRYINLRKVIH